MTIAIPSAGVHWRQPSWRSLALGCAAGVVMSLGEVALIRWLFPQNRGDGVLSVFVFALAGVFLVPAEEWLFRGMILRKLIRPVGAITALVLSSVFFALAHGWVFLPGVAFRFAGGLVLGAAYLWTGSLWPPITLHFTHNVVFAAALIVLTRR